jgi:hypothetical protein
MCRNQWGPCGTEFNIGVIGGSHMNNVVQLNPAADLVRQARDEREQLIEQIRESQKAIERSRHVLFRLDDALARAARLS